MPTTPFHPLLHSLIIHNTQYVCTWSRTDRRTDRQCTFYMVAIEFSATLALLTELWVHGDKEALLTPHSCREGLTDTFNTGNNAVWNGPVWPPSSQMGKIIVA